MKKLIKVIRVSKILFSEERLLFASIIFFTSLTRILAPLILPFVIKASLDSVESGRTKEMVSTLLISTAVYSFLLLIVYIVNVYADVWATQLVFKNSQTSYKKMFDSSVADLMRNMEKGDIFNRIKSGTGASIAFWMTISNVLSVIVSIVVLMIIIRDYAPLVIGTVLVIYIFDAFRIYYQTKKFTRINHDIETNNGTIEGLIRTLTFDADVIRILGVNKEIRGLYSKARDKTIKYKSEQIWIEIFFESISEFIASLSRIFISVGLYEKRETEFVSAGDIGSSFSVYDVAKNKSLELHKSFTAIPSLAVPLERLDDILSSNPQKEEVSDIKLEGIAIKELQYSNNKLPGLLFDINLQINKGERIAVIGGNGEGKSTFIKLLSGMLSTTGGKIKFISNGTGYDPNFYNLNSFISYIPPEPSLFDVDVLTNISMNSSVCSVDEICKQLEEMRIESPQKFLTQKVEELSYGEKKRVSICRAILKPAELLIADEPTSGMDPMTSEVVLDKLLKNFETCIVITHDHSLLGKFDRVISIAGGKVIEVKHHLNG